VTSKFLWRVALIDLLRVALSTNTEAELWICCVEHRLWPRNPASSVCTGFAYIEAQGSGSL
jgi:hypothetical protein